MKKRKLFGLSALITIGLALVNYVTYLLTGTPRLAVRLSTTSASISYIGFGLKKEIWCPEVRADVSVKSWVEMGFEPISLIVSFLVILGIVVLVSKIVQKQKRRKLEN